MTRRQLTWIGITAFAGSAVGLLAAAVAAEDQDAAAKPKYAKLLERHPEADTDGDGTLSQDEARAFFRQQGGPAGGGPRGPGFGGRGRPAPPDPSRILADHPEADKDGDGTLSREEMKAFREAQDQAQRAKLLGEHPELDANKDGVLSEDELRNARLAMLSERLLAEHPEADTDRDGKLSPEEYRAFRGGAGRDRLTPGQAPRLFDQLLERFADADLDHSGELSKEELIKFRERFGGPARGPLGPGAGGPPPPAGAAGDASAAGRSNPAAIKPGADAQAQPAKTADKRQALRERLLQRFPDADKDGDGQLSNQELKTLKEKRDKGAGKQRGKNASASDQDAD